MDDSWNLRGFPWGAFGGNASFQFEAEVPRRSTAFTNAPEGLRKGPYPQVVVRPPWHPATTATESQEVLGAPKKGRTNPS